MHHVGWDYDCHALWNSHTIDLHRLFADPLNPPPSGEETEDFVHHHVKIFHLHDGIIRGSSLGRGIRMVTNMGLEPQNPPSASPLGIRDQGRGNLSSSTSSTLFFSNLAFGSGPTGHRWGQPQHLPTLLYLVGQTGINLILESLLHIRMCGQLIRYVAEGGAGGLITGQDKDKSLGQNLLIT